MRAVAVGLPHMVRPHTEHDALHYIDRALAPVDVHLSMLLAPFRPRIVCHSSPLHLSEPARSSPRTVPTRFSRHLALCVDCDARIASPRAPFSRSTAGRERPFSTQRLPTR